jgi:segregation and condensation protein B
MLNVDLKLVIEALLLSAMKPLTLHELKGAFDSLEVPSDLEILAAIEALKADYKTRAFQLMEGASGYVLQTKIAYQAWIMRLQAEKPPKYSRALLETLAIIAYRQPVTRADIESIRGVVVSSPILKTLLEREWIRVAGHRDVPGKPSVYVTTQHFLEYFNLKSIQELPDLIPYHSREHHEN